MKNLEKLAAFCMSTQQILVAIDMVKSFINELKDTNIAVMCYTRNL